MSQKPAPKISKIPFIVGDLLLLSTAGWLAFRGAPLNEWQAGLVIVAVAIGAWLAATPFILQFRAAIKVAEASELTTVVAQMQDLRGVAAQIAAAVIEWQHIHQSTTQTVTAAGHMAEQVTTEARNFGEILTKINEAEKNHLRLEIEKLRRGEGEWLQVMVRVLDHVHALHLAGQRSGQRNLIEQLTHFQNSCRDTARRIGLTPVVPPPDAAYDPKLHQLLEGETALEGAVVATTLAQGYTFQGQVVRLPLVTVSNNGPAKKTDEPEAQLSLEDRS